MISAHHSKCPECGRDPWDSIFRNENCELTARIANFDAAIRRVADALGGIVCGGVDTADEINPETGLPYGPGGHTGYALERAIVKLKRAHKEEWDRAREACAKIETLERASLDVPIINEWHLNDKAVLADALKEIYAIRGEDAEVAAIVLKALREGCVPGY